MAAINVVRQQAAVHLITDGAYCDNAGIVCEIGPNAFALPHLPAALAILGSTHFMPFLVHRLSRECRSFDDLLPKLVRTAYEVHLSFPMAFGSLGFGSVEPDFDLVAVGWSTSRRSPTGFLLSSHGRMVARGLSANPWQLLELPEVLIAPPLDEEQISASGWTVPHSAEMFRPDVDGAALVKAQRLFLHELNPDFGVRRRVHVVGGFVQLTSVSPRGVNTKILHRWNDAIGRKIEPQA